MDISRHTMALLHRGIGGGHHLIDKTLFLWPWLLKPVSLVDSPSFMCLSRMNSDFELEVIGGAQLDAAGQHNWVVAAISLTADDYYNCRAWDGWSPACEIVAAWERIWRR